ncbi:MAG: hypothetical protein V4636_20070 [Pseudomonadota bacterium]
MSGGSSNSAQRAAEAAEAERQARITSSVGRINTAFDNPARAGELGEYLGATRQFYMDDLNRQKGDTDRNLKFAMARNGQTGGSVSIDNARRVGEDYTRGVVEADRRAQSAVADLRSQDEQSRLGLISMAQSGLDSTTASSRALSALQNNIQAGKATSTAQGIGDAFGSFANLYRRSQEDAARRRGEKDVYGTLYQPGFGFGGRP